MSRHGAWPTVWQLGLATCLYQAPVGSGGGSSCSASSGRLTGASPPKPGTPLPGARMLTSMAAPCGGPGAGSAKSGQAVELVGLGAAAEEATGDYLVTGGSNYNCWMAPALLASAVPSGLPRVGRGMEKRSPGCCVRDVGYWSTLPE